MDEHATNSVQTLFVIDNRHCVQKLSNRLCVGWRIWESKWHTAHCEERSHTVSQVPVKSTYPLCNEPTT